MGYTRFWLPVLAVLLALSGCSQSPQVREAKYLEKGKKEFQKKNYEIAVIQFKNAMQAQPQDAEPYYQLGLCFLAGDDVNTAAAYFRKATQLNSKHTGAQLKLAEIMATSRNRQVVEEAEKRSQDLLALLPDDADALNVLAVTELKLGNPQSAEEHLKQALQKSPKSLQASITLAQTKLSQHDVTGAADALKEAADAQPALPDPRYYLGGLYLAVGRPAEAGREFQRALDIDPKYGPALLALGSVQVKAGRTEDAEQTYRKVSALPDKQYRPVHALYLFQSGKTDQAVAELEKLTNADPGDRNVRTDLVKAYLSLKRVPDAERVLTAALKKNALDVDALLQRSRIYLASAKYTEAQSDLNQVLHYRTDSAEAHYLLAKVHQGRGEGALQQQELGEALRREPGFLSARLELAQVLIASGGAGAESAMKLLDEAPEDQKASLSVLLQRNWSLLAMGQTEEARKVLDQLLAKTKSPEVLIQDAALKLSQKDYAGARAAAEEVLRQSPENVQALHLLVTSYAAQNQLPAALQKAREQVAKTPGSAMLQQYLGELLAATGDHAGARKAFESAEVVKPGLVSAELALAELAIGESNFDEARKRLANVVSSQPGNFPAHMLFGQVEMTQGRASEAIEQYRKAVELDDHNALALNALAYMLSENKLPDEALKYAQKAKELAPDNAAIDDTLGWTYFQKGMYTLAVTHLQDAISRDGTARRRYHLAMAYLKSGDRQKGRQMLDAALKMDPNLPEAKTARQILGSN